MQTFKVDEKTRPAAKGPSEMAFPQGRWTMLSNISLFRNPFAKGPKSKEPQPPVQTEMLLDAVKPVRNDLSDCDLEVVSARQRLSETVGQNQEASTSDVPAGAAEEPPDAGPARGRIKSPFLGAGKS